MPDDRKEKLLALYRRATTPGEREAARLALVRHRARQSAKTPPPEPEPEPVPPPSYPRRWQTIAQYDPCPKCNAYDRYRGVVWFHPDFGIGGCLVCQPLPPVNSKPFIA